MNPLAEYEFALRVRRLTAVLRGDVPPREDEWIDILILAALRGIDG